MKPTVLSLALAMFPAWLGAQEAAKTFRYNANGYVFFTAGSCQHKYANVGAGG